MIVTLMQDKMTKFTFSINVHTPAKDWVFLELINKPDRRVEPGKNVSMGNLNGRQGRPLHFCKLVTNLWPLFTCVYVCVHECASIHAHMNFSANTDFRCRFVWDMVPHHWTTGGQSSETA